MIDNPNYSSFRFYFPKSFFMQETRDKFGPYIKHVSPIYDDIADFINSTVTSAKLPGFFDTGSTVQTVRQGENRTFAAALIAKQAVDKTIKVTMQVRESYLNWAIMYFNMMNWLEDKNQTRENLFLPPVFLQLMDDNDNIMTEFIYEDIQLRAVSDVEFTTKSNGILVKDFDVKLAFNNFDVKFNFDNIQSTRNDSKHSY